MSAASIAAAGPAPETAAGPHRNDPATVERLYRRHVALALDLFGRGVVPPGADGDDLRAAALEGLHDAALRFDEGRGLRFTTYATHCIRGFLLRERWRQRRRGFTNTDRAPTALTLQDDLVGRGPADDGDGSGAPADARDAVEWALAQLRPRHAEVIRRRFGLGRPREDLEAVGRELGVSRERVRQIEGAALKTLRGLLGRGAAA